MKRKVVAKREFVAKTEAEYQKQCEKFQKLFEHLGAIQKLIFEINKVPKNDVPNHMLEDFLSPHSYDLYSSMEDLYEDTVTTMRMDFEILNCE